MKFNPATPKYENGLKSYSKLLLTLSTRQRKIIASMAKKNDMNESTLIRQMIKHSVESHGKKWPEDIRPIRRYINKD